MKSRLNFIKSLATGLFGGAAILSSNTANAATSETISSDEKLADLSKKVKELEKINKASKSEGSAFITDGFLGEMRMFSGNYAPRNWAFCNGQILPIAQNQSLYSILDDRFGGDGRTTFGLPDLRGRVPIHPGSGPGLTQRNLGQNGGLETTQNNTSSVAGPGRTGNVNVQGGNSSDNNMQPFLAVNFIICIAGVYPSRS